MPKRRSSSAPSLFIFLFLIFAVGITVFILSRNNFDIRERAVGYCQENGNSCVNPGDCCSGSCTNFTCVAPGSVAAPLPSKKPDTENARLNIILPPTNESSKPNETRIVARTFSELGTASNVNNKTIEGTSVSKPAQIASAQNSTVKVQNSSDQISQSALSATDLALKVLAQVHILDALGALTVSINSVSDTANSTVKTKSDLNGTITVSVPANQTAGPTHNTADINQEVVGQVMGAAATQKALLSGSTIANPHCPAGSCRPMEAYVNAVASSGIAKVDDRGLFVSNANQTNAPPRELSVAKAFSDSAANYVTKPKQNTSDINTVMESLYTVAFTPTLDDNGISALMVTDIKPKQSSLSL